MIELDDIERQIKAFKFWNNVNISFRENKCLIWVVRDKVSLGYIELSKQKDNWQVEWAEFSVKGKGKLLYYIALNTIYPERLSPHRKRTSDASQKVWARIEQIADANLFGVKLPRKLNTEIEEESRPYTDIESISARKTRQFTLKPRSYVFEQ